MGNTSYQGKLLQSIDKKNQLTDETDDMNALDKLHTSANLFVRFSISPRVHVEPFLSENHKHRILGSPMFGFSDHRKLEISGNFMGKSLGTCWDLYFRSEDDGTSIFFGDAENIGEAHFCF